MKKRMIVLLAALCTVAMIGGCGDKKDGDGQEAKNGTEADPGHL